MWEDIVKTIGKMGRYGGYGGLQKFVLFTLSEGPKNGVEIMRAIETMSYGSWRPSPGSIYPMLGKLVEEGLIRKVDNGRYELTRAGQESAGFGWGFTDKPYSAERIVAEMDSYISYLEDLPKDRLSPYEDKIGAMSERLRKIKESMRK
jgi:DNA-binding PadR family transcriptional regulator